MSDSSKQQDTDAEPYVNDFQQWLGESEDAEKFLALWHFSCFGIVGAGVMRYGVLVTAIGTVLLLAGLIIHYWRDEVAPEMRYVEENDA